MRHTRTRELMKKDGLDAIFITGEENFHYFTGGGLMSRHASNSRPAIAILPAEGDIISVTHLVESHTLKSRSLVKDIRSYQGVTGVPNELLVRALKDAGIRNRRVGMEYGLEQRLGMPFENVMKLTKSLKGIKFVDASHIIWKIRMIKSKAEVNYIREACRITGNARQKCFGQIEPGMTEREVVRIFRYIMLNEGADDVSFIHISAGVPVNHCSQLAREKRLKKGHTINLDGGAYVRTYTCDYPRIATVGKPSLKQVRAHKIITGINRKMMGAIKPGRTCSDIFRVGYKELKRSGLPTQLAGRMGHGQGLMITEPPSVTVQDKTLLQPGLVFSTEPDFHSNYGIFTFEDIHVVTDDGYEQLSKESEELRQIGV